MTGPRLAVRAIQGKGRGVVALVPLRAGETLERAPAVELGAEDTERIALTRLDDYYFAHPGDPEGGLIVLGLATLVNHGERPNAETVTSFERGVGWTVALRALRDIAAGEEITRRYACPPWFEPVP